MRFVAAAAMKDLRRRLSDPVALVIWIGIPLAIGGLMNLVVGGIGSAPPRARVLVADQDNTVLSRLLAGASGAPGLGDVIDLEPATLEDGRRRIEAGGATALLVIPAGFQAAVLDDTPVELLLLTNPAQRILPGIVEEALGLLVEGVFYAQRLFGSEIRRIPAGMTTAGGPPADADVAAGSVGINARLRQLEGVLLPPIIDLEVRVEETRAGAGLDFGQLFFPGILFMSILFIAQGMSLDIWQERARGTLRRVLTTPQSAARLLAGKLAAGTALVGFVVFVALVGSTAVFGVAWTRLPLALLWCMFAGAALLALMTLLHVSATSERGANLLSTIIIFPLIMIGGSFFPFEAMPAWMAGIGRWTPNGLALVRLKEILFGEPAAAALLLAAVGIGAPGLAAFVLTARRLRGPFAAGA
jgi:ABC-type multidrug transport system permease subunit